MGALGNILAPCDVSKGHLRLQRCAFLYFYQYGKVGACTAMVFSLLLIPYKIIIIISLIYIALIKTIQILML